MESSECVPSVSVIDSRFGSVGGCSRILQMPVWRIQQFIMIVAMKIEAFLNNLYGLDSTVS